MKQKNRGGRTAALILLLAVSSGWIILSLQKDNFVIYFGIAVYRTVHLILAGLLAAAAVWLAAAGVVSLRSRKKESEPSLQQEKSPSLSVREKLHNASLRELLKEEASGRWSPLSGDLHTTIEQMEQMDVYQERLHSLLKENDMKALSDTEEVLEQAEQALCQNVRRLINYMGVFDEKDVDVVRSCLIKTNEKNQEQLDQVRDFVVAVTDFVNRQGSAGQDPDLLNTYKTMILESLKEEL